MTDQCLLTCKHGTEWQEGLQTFRGISTLMFPFLKFQETFFVGFRNHRLPGSGQAGFLRLDFSWSQNSTSNIKRGKKNPIGMDGLAYLKRLILTDAALIHCWQSFPFLTVSCSEQHTVKTLIIYKYIPVNLNIPLQRVSSFAVLFIAHFSLSCKIHNMLGFR